MSARLMIFVILVVVLFLIYVIRSVKNGTLSIRNSLMWIILSVAMVLSVVALPLLERFASFLGIEVVTNMLFFIGFVFLLFIVLECTKTISQHNEEIAKLTQEVALLKENKKGNDADK